MFMNKLTKDLQIVVGAFIDLVEKFPISKREEIFLENWNLKDILVHLTGWANYQKKILEQFKKDKSLTSQNNLKDLINGQMVAKNKNTKWEIVFKNFKKSTNELITEYTALPEKHWIKKIFEDKDITPEDFIKIEIKHYRETHGLQVMEFIKK